jgi:hypothetical protein
MEKYTYKIIETPMGNGLLRSDGASIPFDEANSDYQAYLNKDKAEQSTPIVINEAETI